MSTFVEAVANQEARTENGMKARKSTASAVVDLFYNIGASRGKDIKPAFTAAFIQNKDLALRIAAWSRDARGGAGERQVFRDILLYLEQTDTMSTIALMNKVPELGRWDDLLVFKTKLCKQLAFEMIKNSLEANNGLCAKWMPRKGDIAVELRNYLGWSPKFYRKRLVELTNVVETLMCSGYWDNINFSHVPSLASARYKKAFNRNTEKYAEYVASLVKGDVNVKVNAGAVYPYDVLKGTINAYGMFDKTESDLIQKQWEALPNFVGDANILPMVDVSGSMTCPAGGVRSKSSLTCMDVAISLGLYLADKNTGKFKDTFLTFSQKSELVTLKGNIMQKITQMSKSNWDMSTNLHAAFEKILRVAKDAGVPQSEMPEMVLIMSDMQFDQCVRHDDSAMQMIERKYQDAGYAVPKVVFWNLNASYGNMPISFDKKGTALVSGFSPAIVKPLLAGDLENFTPENIMLQTIMQDRYAVL